MRVNFQEFTEKMIKSAETQKTFKNPNIKFYALRYNKPDMNTTVVMYCVEKDRDNYIIYCPNTRNTHYIENGSLKNFLEHHIEIEEHNYNFRCNVLGLRKYRDLEI